MSVPTTITATPVPNDLPKVPTRIIYVDDKVINDCVYSYSRVTDAFVQPAPPAPEHFSTFRLPGTDEAEALAELEKASEELAGLLDAGNTVVPCVAGTELHRWLEALNRLREVQAEQSGGAK